MVHGLHVQNWPGGSVVGLWISEYLKSVALTTILFQTIFSKIHVYHTCLRDKDSLLWSRGQICLLSNITEAMFSYQNKKQLILTQYKILELPRHRISQLYHELSIYPDFLHSTLVEIQGQNGTPQICQYSCSFPSSE